jgi:eukaryotic-like serine/threonine-protein kinase
MTPTERPHHVIGERYRLEEPIGRGGMGTVWRATDTRLDRSVAVKDVLVPPYASAGERRAAQTRLLREAHAAARINDPAVVTVHDVIGDDDRMYLVMEHVPAPSLDAVVADRGPLPIDEVTALGVRLAGALAAAHERHVIHRDVKPSNVLLPNGGGAAKLVDFGVAALADAPGITTSGLAIGSPSFVSPEQADGQPATAASDVFSLGATLYFAAEGHAPFEQPSTVATLAAVTSKPPPPPTRAGRLGPVVLPMMDKDPARRPSLDDVRNELTELSSPVAVPAPGPVDDGPDAAAAPAGPATRVVTSMQDRPRPPASQADTPGRRRRWLVLGASGAAAVLVAGGAAIVAALGDDSGGANPPAETGAPNVPAGFVEYVDPQGGFKLLIPEGFTPRLDAGRHFTEFLSEHTAITVRWFEPGTDPAAYLDAEQQWIGALPHYQSLAERQQPFGEHPGALWEYQFAWEGDPNRRLHAIGRVFAVGDHTFGLWFRAPAEQYAAQAAQIFTTVAESFQPLVG